MGCRMRLEREAVKTPPLDVPPGEVRKPSPAIGDIPAIQPPREVRDHEAPGREPHVPHHGEGVVPETTIGVVEGDEEIAIARTPLAANTCTEVAERNATPAGRGQRAHLRGETAW